MPLEFARLSAKQLAELPKTRTVFFFPVGALEDHGPHLPLSLDVLEAQKLCELAAGKLEREMHGWTGVIMPSAPLSVSSDTTRMALTVRGHVLRDWLVDFCKGLTRAGFAHFVCFSGNLGPRQLTAIEEAGKIVSKRGLLAMLLEALGHRPSAETPKPTLVSVMSGLISANRVMESPLWPDPVEHGGRRDTAVALALQAIPPSAPELTELPPRPRPTSRWQRLWDRLSRRSSGYWGPSSPAEATPAWGQSVLETTVNDAFPKLKAVWEGANPNFLFRSYYSVFPPNKSFFKGWLLAVFLIALLVAWYWMAFQSLAPSE
jgi:creatinine amidohydrolase/Fe(II)-dependent formamide hydrolase-like protein